MAHQIHHNKFVTYRKPAWHRLGTVFQEPLSASEAWTLMGPYDVMKAPLFAYDALNNGEPVSVAGKYAVTGVFKDLSQQYHYGIVDERYELITPQQLVHVWEMTTNAKIETMGVLQHGKRFFFTTELPGFDVKGDEHQLFLSIISPHGTGQSLMMLISPVRVVCANTAQMAIAQAKVECRIPHVKGALSKTGAWLKEQWESSVDKTNALQQALQILSNRTMTSDMVDTYMSDVLPLPDESEEEAYSKVVGVHDTVKALFDGEARGAYTRAFDGTLFGMYNSVVEYADYHTKSRAAAGSWGFGAGAKLKERAFDVAMSYANS